VNTPEDSGTPGPANQVPVATLEKPSVDPNNPPWGFLAAFFTWLGSVVLLYLIPQLSALPYLATHYRGVIPTREMLLADKTFILIVVSCYIPVHIVTLILAWAVVTKVGKFSVTKVLGLEFSDKWEILWSIGLAILLLCISGVIIYWFGGQDTEIERILRSSRAAAIITAFLAAFSAPLVEEVIYRGLLYSALQRLTGPIVGVIAVTALFAGLHVLQYWPNGGAIAAISLLSLVLTVVRARAGRLLPCYIIHLVFNGIQSIFILMEPYTQSIYDLWRHKAASGILHSLFPVF
jgi:CAAX protease family protein